MSFAIGASLNHGNSENGTKSSSASSISQKPWFETFVTSTSKVLVPGIANDLLVRFNHRPNGPQLPIVESVILRQFNGRFKPEFGLPIRAVYVHVHARLLTREEKEPEPTFPENRRTHKDEL